MGSSKGLFKRRGGDVDESHTFLGFDVLALWLGILLPSPLNSFSIKAEIMDSADLFKALRVKD